MYKNISLPMPSRKNLVFILCFSAGSVALLIGSWLQFIPFSLTEDLGFITGALTVWLTVVENIWNFPIGIANEIFFFVLFLRAGLFADMSLQILYVFLSLQGWYLWLRGGKNKTTLHISHISKTELAVLGLLAIIATYAMTLYLQHIEDTAPFLDALTTVLSIIAQYMLNKKYLENWYVWIVADIIYIPLYAYKQLYLTSAVYMIFLLMCIFGLKTWKRAKGRQ